jgi:hypothetical protein
MGLDFIRADAKRFEQKRDKSKILELDVEDLLSRGKPDAFVPLFRCQLTDEGAGLVERRPVFGRFRPGSDCEFNIFRSNKVVGVMLPEDARELARLMKTNNRYHGVISLIVEHPPDFDGILQVRSKSPFKGHD